MRDLILVMLAGLTGYLLFKKQIGALSQEGTIENLPQIPGQSETTKLQVSQEGNLQIQLKPQIIKKDGQPIATYVPRPITVDLNKLVASITNIFSKKEQPPVVMSTPPTPPTQIVQQLIQSVMPAEISYESTDKIIKMLFSTMKCPIDGLELKLSTTNNTRSAGTIISCPKHGILAYQTIFNKPYIVNEILINYL